MADSGAHVRNRHGGASPGQAVTRETHGYSGVEVAVTGVTYSDARDGEQSQTGDVAPGSVQTGHFSPQAFAPNVNNNPLEPTVANVVIDDVGLHITDGALYLTDYGGTSVLGPAGFDGSWVEFIRGGVYNGGFNAGITSWVTPGVTGSGDAVQATTIVNSAATPEDYLASLSAAIPYWIVSQYSSSDTSMRARILADSTEGRYLNVERPTNGLGASVAGGSMTFIQDAPVIQRNKYEIRLNISGIIQEAASSVEVRVGWRDSEHGQITAESLLDSIGYSHLLPNVDGVITFSANAAPLNAKYARISIKVIHGTAPTGAGSTIILESVSLVAVGVVRQIDFPHVISGEVAYSWLRASNTSITFNLLDAPTGVVPFHLTKSTESNPFLKLSHGVSGGVIDYGVGPDSPDVSLGRGAADRLDLASGDSLRIVGGELQFGSDVVLSRPSSNVLALASGDRLDSQFIGRKLTRASNLSVTNATWTKIGNPATWATEFFDSVEGTVTFTGNTDASLKVNAAGRYLVFATVYWDNNTAGGRIAGFSEGNPPSAVASSSILRQILPAVSVGGVGLTQMFSAVREYAVNAEVSLCVYQDSGGTRTIHSATFGMVRLGS